MKALMVYVRAGPALMQFTLGREERERERERRSRLSLVTLDRRCAVSPTLRGISGMS